MKANKINLILVVILFLLSSNSICQKFEKLDKTNSFDKINFNDSVEFISITFIETNRVDIHRNRCFMEVDRYLIEVKNNGKLFQLPLFKDDCNIYMDSYIGLTINYVNYQLNFLDKEFRQALKKKGIRKITFDETKNVYQAKYRSNLSIKNNEVTVDFGLIFASINISLEKEGSKTVTIDQFNEILKFSRLVYIFQFRYANYNYAYMYFNLDKRYIGETLFYL
jgi:hypothetical protein